MAGVMSTPMPSPSMYGMTGSSGTVTEPSLLATILAPVVGGVSLSYDAIRSLLEPAVYRLLPRFATAPAGHPGVAPCDGRRMAHRRVLLGLLAFVACGDDDGDSTAPDASRPVDAAPPDAALRAGLWYLMDSIAVPETSNEAVTVALDLDGDGQPDNALGGLLAAMHNSADLPIAAVQMDAVTSGHILQLVGIDASSLDDADSLPVLVSRGIDLDGEPGDNASGAQPFALDPLDGADGQLTGVLAAGRLRAGPGTAPIQLAMFGVTPELVALRGVGARIRAPTVTDGEMTGGRTCGALTDEEADSLLIPAMARAVDSIVQRDCDGATC